MTDGTFVIITGPSGSGKTTIAKGLLSRIPNSTRLVTITTRPARAYEQDGRDYHFVSREEFLARRDRGELFEWDEHYGEYYGSSRTHLHEALASHSVVFAVIDVNGAGTIRALMPDALIIFVDVPDIMQIRQRLAMRNMPDDVLQRRLEKVREEQQRAPLFDATVINADGGLQGALESCEAIIKRYQAKP